ncbi:MAG: hypothetical protein RLZZ584_1391 [Pseudomonadota bacterium]|jgi:membrane-associated phospholipid phosphatase
MNPLPRNARTRELRLWLAALALVGGVFGAWPAADLWLAALFFEQAAGAGPAGFSAARQALVLAVYQVVPWLGRAGLLLGLLAWVWPALQRRRHGGWVPGPAQRRWRRRLLVLLAVLVLGLWLAVNVVLKEGWGRPRPEQVGEFGGARVFQPWWQPSRQCPTNCSFVSGHAATGYVLLGVGLLAAPRRRRRWLLAGLLAGLGVGLVRMVQGGHFASDILGAGLVIWGTGIAVRRWALAARLRRWRGLSAPGRP